MNLRKAKRRKYGRFAGKVKLGTSIYSSGPARGFGYTVSWVSLTKVFGIFLPKYGYKVFCFPEFFGILYISVMLVFFPFLKCLILSACVAFTNIMKDLQFLRDLIRMRAHAASGHEWWFVKAVSKGRTIIFWKKGGSKILKKVVCRSKLKRLK